MNESIYKKIADLMLFAVDAKANDKICLVYDYNLREAAHAVSGEAYKRGVSYVHLEVWDEIAQAQAIAGKTPLFAFPEFWKPMLTEMTSSPWKSITLSSDPDGDAFAGLDSARTSDYLASFARAREIRRNAFMSNALPWTVTYLPSAALARKAFPELPGEAGIGRYWESVIRVMRLDHDDPVAFWKGKMIEDGKRSEFMNGLCAEYLHFEGPGTDLKVALAKTARWIGGFDVTSDGRRFMANIPTDEIFTSPDWRLTNGRVRLTKPFAMNPCPGPIPRGAWFEFKDGMVTDYGADEGRETLTALFAIDPRAKYLGEVALVDPRSPFAREGVTFYNGLYDENAACHIALGKAYPSTLRERTKLSDDELLERGLNTASIHEDMMIGGEDVTVSAILAGGKRVPLIQGGQLLI